MTLYLPGKKICILTGFIIIHLFSYAQNKQAIEGIVYDSVSREAVTGAVIVNGTQVKAISDANGRFRISASDSLLCISAVGYAPKRFMAATSSHCLFFALTPAHADLEQVIVSASRSVQKRSEAPVAIASINKQTIDDKKPQRIDQLLNSISGVFMVNLGNEQHEMSIRQPMTTKSLFLYMEDGIPIRTTGVYNHNALLEMNITAAKSMEVVKGPSSALYGAEAVAGAVNVLTQAPSARTAGNISMQLNNNGYHRIDVQTGTSSGKWGIIASGHFANRTDGPVEHSDFHKAALTIRTDYKPDVNTAWTSTFTYVDYYSDMTGTLDSIKFAEKNYSTPYTFTYRSVAALRVKSMLAHTWSQHGESSVSLVYRSNTVKQNPSYSIGSTPDPLLYKGQINDNRFMSFALFMQHTQHIRWLNGKLVTGASIDMSPQDYNAQFIWIQKDALSGKYAHYAALTPDSLLQRYHTGISNMAGYVQQEMNVLKNMKLVAALRYDVFRYDFRNRLDTSKTTVAVSTVNHYERFTPKLGLVYTYKGIGWYANYSEGYVPPQLTELYASGSKVAPYLLPQVFSSYETGGWLSLMDHKLYADWSLYLMNGSNEIISVKQPDNTYTSQNAGKTRHAGIEYGIQYKPSPQWSIRWSATHARHIFIENIVRGVNYNGREMSAAPGFTSNMEVWYKPAFIKGFRLGGEWQHQGSYYMDDLDQYTYHGFDVVNIRAGYQFKQWECWINILNAFDQYYSALAVKNAAVTGNASYAYQPGDPRETTIGIGYRFGK